MDDEIQTWWYGFDPVTFEYAGMRLAAEKPENATDVNFDGITDPVWNPDKNIWEGNNLEEELAKLREQAENDEMSAGLPFASLMATVADLKETTDTSIMALMGQVADLQSQIDSASSSTDANS